MQREQAEAGQKLCLYLEPVRFNLCPSKTSPAIFSAPVKPVCLFYLDQIKHHKNSNPRTQMM